MASRRSSASSSATEPRLAPGPRLRTESDPAAADAASWDIFEPRAPDAATAPRPASLDQAQLANGSAAPKGGPAAALDLRALKALSGARGPSRTCGRVYIADVSC